MYFFASLLGLWLVSPVAIPEVGPIYPNQFTILRGEQASRSWYWYTENSYFRLNEIYLIKGDVIAISDGVFIHSWINNPADFNADGFCNGKDFDDYVKAFEAGHQWADFNGDTFVNGVDYDLFAEKFIEGC